jgi:acyl-CoA dehydrogenase
MEKLQQERLVCAIGAQAGIEVVLDETIKYTQERQAFGKPIAKFQNTQFKLAEIATEVELGRVFVDRLIDEHMPGTPIIKETSMAKWWVTEMCKRNIDSACSSTAATASWRSIPSAAPTETPASRRSSPARRRS